MMKREAAVITVYLSLVFLLLISLTGVLLESASVQTAKNNAKAQTNLALEAAFAEYDPDLFDRYHVFAVDTGRDGGGDPEEVLLSRLHFYRADTGDAGLSKVQYLSDRSGEAFYEQAVRYMSANGLAEGAVALARQAGLLQDAEEEEKSEWNAQAQMIAGAAGELAQSEDLSIPGLSYLAGVMGGALLDQVTPQGMTVSSAEIDAENAASNRQLRSGYGEFSQKADLPALEKELFNSYLFDVMESAADGGKEEGLSYEIEYILAGKETDRDNLEETVGRLLMIRTALNLRFLATDAAKQAEATEMAAFLSTVLLSPEAEPVLKEAIIFAWACGESLMDIKALLDGRKIPLTKDASSWTLSLGGLLSFERSAAEGWESKEDGDGWSYEDYLRVLIAIEGKQNKCMRALDLIEVNMSAEREHAFKSDGALCRAQVKSSCALPRSVRYDFTTAFGYR